jgi:hypothetical protein
VEKDLENTRRHIPEVINLPIHRREGLKSRILSAFHTTQNESPPKLSPTRRGPVYKCYFWGAGPCARLANRVVSQGETVCLQRWKRHNGIYKIIRPQLVFFSENKIYHLMSNNKFIQNVKNKCHDLTVYKETKSILMQ